jgi:hypothetical protein
MNQNWILLFNKLTFLEIIKRGYNWNVGSCSKKQSNGFPWEYL